MAWKCMNSKGASFELSRRRNRGAAVGLDASNDHVTRAKAEGLAV